MPDPPKQSLPEHAASHRARRSGRIAYAMVGLGGLGAVVGVAVGVTQLALFGVFYVLLGLLLRRQARTRARSLSAFVLLQQAGSAIEEDDLERAERLLASVPEDASPQMRRGAAIVRAQLALRRGELERSAKLLDEVLASPTEILNETTRAVQLDLAHASRALVAAALGDEARAREEVAIVSGSATALPQARARAVLAEALLLEKRGALADLEALLERHRPVLQRATDPSERLLVRTLWRRLQLPKQAVYRKQAAAIESATSRFLTALSPALASLAEDDLRPTDAAARKTTPPAARPLGGPAPKGGSVFTGRGVLIGALAAVVVIGVAIRLVAVGGGRSSVGGFPLVAAFPVLGAAVLVAWVVSQIVRSRRDGRRLVAAMTALGEGHLEEATRRAEEIARNGTMAAVAQAELLLASVAIERGDAEQALAHARRGRESVTWASVREALEDSTIANLVTMEAYALAALGKTDESSALLASLPPNAFERRQRFLVEQIGAITRDDTAALAQLVERAPAALPVYDELLRDVARATTRGVSLAEHRRISAELARPEQQRFVARFAPALLERFQRGDEPTQIAGWEIDAESAAVAEAEAEVDAARAERRVS